MKPYGLFKVIDKTKNNLQFELYNKLHPDKLLLNTTEHKSFLDFFYEDNPIILKAGIDIQLIEYIKFKKELDQIINKKTISPNERDILNKMLLRVIKAENKFTKYMKLDNNNKILDDLEKKQSRYAKNIGKYLDQYYNYINLSKEDVPYDLGIIFDYEQVDMVNYENTIMYKNSVISFYRTGINCDNGKIIFDNKDNRIEYLVFELEAGESVKIINDEKYIEKLQTISKLYEEINMPVPGNIKSKLKNISKLIEFIYNNKKLMLYPIDNEQELIYEIIKE